LNATSSLSAFTDTVAIRFDGAVVAWGSARNGLLGHLPATNGDQSCPTSPTSTAPCNPTPQAIPTLP
jgi:hypothetical protein